MLGLIVNVVLLDGHHVGDARPGTRPRASSPVDARNVAAECPAGVLTELKESVAVRAAEAHGNRRAGPASCGPCSTPVVIKSESLGRWPRSRQAACGAMA